MKKIYRPIKKKSHKVMSFQYFQILICLLPSEIEISENLVHVIENVLFVQEAQMTFLM